MIAFDNCVLLVVMQIIFNMKIFTRSRERASFQKGHSTLRSRHPTCQPSHYSRGKQGDNLLVTLLQVKFWGCEGDSSCVCHHEQFVVSCLISESFGDIKIYELNLRVTYDVVCDHHVVWVYVSIDDE